MIRGFSTCTSGKSGYGTHFFMDSTSDIVLSLSTVFSELFLDHPIC
jgi:hypothetical protein